MTSIELKASAKSLADTDIHFADAKKEGMSTLCGKPIPPAKTSLYHKGITCEACKGQSNWRAIPERPESPLGPRRRR
jgi:hypothetical protein